ncbi:MAG: type I-G CRISPR-associated helicase/endonuclease Cas3g, partial [Acidimicrobiales bacterium]
MAGADLSDGRAALSFAEVVRRAAGHEPYPYQLRIADEGLPEALWVPTGAGKTLAVVLGWLYRRRYHPDPEVRARMPHWLVVALPMRALVSQTLQAAGEWLANLGLADEVGLHLVVGGLARSERTWRDDPAQDAVLVGTVDMLVSRALNRGYGDSRWLWPVDFGLFNNGAHWVLDEVQLMAEALPTTRQLQGLREVLGTALPTSSTWMSATLDPKELETVDRRSVEPMVRLGGADEASGLGRLLNAAKTVRELQVPQALRRRGDATAYVDVLADGVIARHKPGSRTLVVLNSVARAQELYSRLRRTWGAVGKGPNLVLLHSRFRPADRAAATERALASVDEAGPGSVVVATQVIEAGVDMSCRTMLTEAAPWSSMVQRAGRCNRAAEAEGAELWWVEPPGPWPYAEEPFRTSTVALRQLEGQQVTPGDMQEKGPSWRPPARYVLRRRDLLELFDTLPDLSGADTDVSRFVREAKDIDVEVAWRELTSTGKEAGPGNEALPAHDERCRVPLGRARQWLKELQASHPGEVVAWRVDHLSASDDWVPCGPGDLRPGLVLVVPAGLGGYDPEIGWLASSTSAVETLQAPEGTAGLSAEDLSTGADPATWAREWQSLYDHLASAKEEAEKLVELLCGQKSASSLRPEHSEAIVTAAALHDIGKAHPVFQATLERLAEKDGPRAALADRPWAKSGLEVSLRHSRR